ncbi:hypothetical protein Hanom_Chr01g00055071 [Helianthus anomalus]
MELRSRMKMATFQTFWIQMRKNKPLDESRKTGQTSGTKMTFYSKLKRKTNKDCTRAYLAVSGSNTSLNTKHVSKRILVTMIYFKVVPLGPKVTIRPPRVC